MRALVLLLLATSLPLDAAPAWGDLLKQTDAWYASPEAAAVADAVVLYQTAPGGWPKNTDMTAPPSADFLAHTEADHRAPTIDNGATTTQIELLARIVSATGHPAHRAAVERGLDYLLAAQSPSGGWPQYFPLRQGYYTHITYNDNAMINVLTLLRAVSLAVPPYRFVSADQRARATTAVQRGVACILATQVRQDGHLTLWCAQHDEHTLAPAPARRFEPASLSGSESTGIVRFLLKIEAPSPEVIAAIEGAVTWLQAHAVRGLRIETLRDANGQPDRRAVPDPDAPPLWARFYELGTNRPLFVGRDEVVHYDFNEIERERRAGYSYFGTWPAQLLEKDYPRWQTRLARHASRD